LITLLPFGRVISLISVIYGIITCVILWFTYSETTSLVEAVSIASGGAAILQAFLTAFFCLGWQAVWAKFPILNQLLFPNLNGTWDMVVHWEWDNKKGVSRATAVIRQSFLKIGIDVVAPDSESQTLLAKPKKDAETGRAVLYYVFLATPNRIAKVKNQEPYQGAAILKLSLDGTNSLCGNYFTSRQSGGHYELTRSSNRKPDS